MEIKRDSYLEQLISYRFDGLVKVITGIRRCGKSYLLKNIYRNYLIENGVKEYLTAELKKAGIEVCITDSFLTSGKALEKLAEYDHVLLIEQIGSTRYEDLSAELRICLEQQAEVLGTIVLN